MAEGSALTASAPVRLGRMHARAMGARPQAWARFRRPAAAVACGALTAVLALAAGWPFWRGEPALAAVNAFVAGAFVSSGVLLVDIPLLRRTGVLVLASGVCWALTWLLCRESGPRPALGLFTNALFFVAFAWGVLLYPDGCLTGRADRVVGTLTTIAYGPLVALSMVVSEPEWNGFPAQASWPTLWAGQAFFGFISGLYVVINAALAMAFVALLARRWSRLYGLERSVVAPALGTLGVVALCLAALSPTLYNREPGHVAEGVAWQGVALAVLPLVLVSCELWRAVAVATAADRMLRSSGGAATVTVVRDALRRALRDDTVEVYFWLADERRFVDIAGQPATSAPEPGAVPASGPVSASGTAPGPGAPVPPRRGAPALWSQPVTAPSGELFALVTGRSPVLRRHGAFTGAALRTARLSLQNAHLQVTIQAQLVETRAARRRVEEAEAAERGRIARDLHDGVQQRLLALAMLVSVAEWSADDPTAAAAMFGDIRAGLLAANDEVRTIARGLDPETLRTAGLVAAVRQAAARLALPVEVDVALGRGGPFGDVAERTVYFAVSEALANVVKHARATTARVRLTERPGGLVAEVSDNGCGGAVEHPAGGLAGLRDRVAAAGGEVRLSSPVGGPTTVMVIVPTGVAS
ncbi:histidine kinase [Parafrankia sp. EUN1f]|uniref:sensor histidine kinase n=1 Tax=Parafrankia sp. EUN1f TaxID=102897 RepID=UPI0001C46D45|nr:histidine kinase [Parafrankia sp. EUN1f]EFC79967.1 histidine kinase [Parafrankia sp. EUN1f]